jgi:hypothetical protein
LLFAAPSLCETFFISLLFAPSIGKHVKMTEIKPGSVDNSSSTSGRQKREKEIMIRVHFIPYHPSPSRCHRHHHPLMPYGISFRSTNRRRGEEGTLEFSHNGLSKERK